MAPCKTCSLYPLPLLPSKLLKQALWDFEICELDGYHLDPTDGITFNPFDSEDLTPLVGLAGAIVIKSLGLEPNRDHPAGWDSNNAHARFVEAVGHLSAGKIDWAIDELGITRIPESLPSVVPLPNYETNPEAYKHSIEEIIALLKSNGL